MADILEAEAGIGKRPLIMIIDEVFDYLDDANLVAAQYYITKMIAHHKAHGVQVLPIIMTHLNPLYFRTFVFSDQKVHFLDTYKAKAGGDVERILLARNTVDRPLQDKLSRHYFHYCPEALDLTDEFTAAELPLALATADSFRTHVDAEMDKYRAGKPGYDPLAVCCALRLRVEKNVYEMLGGVDQPGFVDQHKTIDKIEYAVGKGADVPEVYSLLRILYNDAAHIRSNTDNISPICMKLANKVLRSMILSV